MTIPKNTKRAEAILAHAANIKVFSLSNGFSGQPLAEQPVIWGGELVNHQFTKLVPVSEAEFLAHELEGRGPKMVERENGRYCIRVHSNLWYEFTSKVSV